MSVARQARLKRAVFASFIGFVFMPLFNGWFTGFQHRMHWIGLHKFTGPACKLLGAIAFVYAVIMIIEFLTKPDDTNKPLERGSGHAADEPAA